MKRLKNVMLASLALFCIAGAADSATWDLFDNAALSNTGPSGETVLRLMSPNGGADPYGYIRYQPDTPFVLNSLAVLSTDFNMVQGPFVGGSPRFDIGLDFNKDGLFDWTNDRTIKAYWGTQPWGGGTPPTGWTGTGNFMDNSLWGAVTFFDGNTQYTLAQLMATFGDLNVMRAYIGLDSGWAGQTQILDLTNFRVNGDAYSPSAVPIPAAVWLLGSGVVGLVALKRKRQK